MLPVVAGESCVKRKHGAPGQNAESPVFRSAIGGELCESRVAGHRSVQRLDHSDRRGLS